jgi:hypothetical protein
MIDEWRAKYATIGDDTGWKQREALLRSVANEGMEAPQ